MSKTLKQGEAFIRFLFDSFSSKKQIRFILVNGTLTHFKVLTEIFHNLLKNKDNLHSNLKQIIQKRKRLISKFISLYKQTNQTLQRKFILKHFQTLYLILLQTRKFIFNYLPTHNQ